MRRILVLAAVLFTACSPGDDGDERTAPSASPDVLVERRADLPTPRTEVGGASFGGDGIIVVGGLTADGAASDLVHLYDAAADEWREGPRLPVAVHHTAVVSARDRAFVIGGFLTDGESSAVWSLGPGEPGWREEPTLPAPRGAHGAAATEDGTIVAFGGVSGGQVVATTTVLRPGATAWEAGPDMAEPREHLAATTIGGRVYAIAGRVGSLESNKRTVESWDPSGREGEWRREPSLNDARGGTSASGVCVAGGEQPAGTIASVECLDGERWRRTAELSQPRHGVAVVDIDGTLHVVAGGDEPGLFVTGTHEVIVPEG